MNLFYAGILNEGGGSLAGQEAHHAVKVLRKSVGHSLLVTQGKGIIYEAEITAFSKSEVQFKNIGVFKQEQRLRRLHIAVAPTKSNERFEFFLEKATELGVDTITPIICSNSERKVYKTERGQKIIQAAAKQSLSCYLPQLQETQSFKQFLKALEEPGQKLIAHCAEGDKQSFFEMEKQSSCLILIGPEGDFSPEETEAALKDGFQAISLGDKRLRTETAALAACFGYLYT